MTHRNWPVLKVGEIALIIMGQSPPGDTYNTEGLGIPLINGPAEYGLVHPTPVQWTSKPTRLCETGDILFCVRGNTTGRMNWADQEYCIGRGIAAIRGKNGASDTPFLRYLLEYLRPDLYSIAIAGGSTFPNINAIQLSSREAAIPSLPEQRAIARVLRAVQTAREARQCEVALERERKAALMAHLFTHGTRGEPTKQTPIGEMPESWKLLKLGDVITLQRGFDLPARDRKPGPFPVISSSGLFARHVEPKVAGPGVVTGRYGTIGDVFYIESAFWPLNTTLFVREFKDNDPLFISYFLQTVNLSLLNDKTSVPGINRNAAHAIPVGLPSLAEQQDIAKVLYACDAKIAALERESALLDELFRALLEELMTGRLSVMGTGDGNG